MLNILLQIISKGWHLHYILKKKKVNKLLQILRGIDLKSFYKNKKGIDIIDLKEKNETVLGGEDLIAWNKGWIYFMSFWL